MCVCVCYNTVFTFCSKLNEIMKNSCSFSDFEYIFYGDRKIGFDFVCRKIQSFVNRTRWVVRRWLIDLYGL